MCYYILCRKAILRYGDFLHGQAWHLWCGPAAMGCGCELARKATPHSCWPIALLGAKDWPWFSYNIKVVNVYFEPLALLDSLHWNDFPTILITSMPVLIPLEETNLGFHPALSHQDRDQAACIYLCSMNVRQCSLSFQRTSPYIAHTTWTFNDGFMTVFSPLSHAGLQLPTRWPPYAAPWDCSCRPVGPHLPPVGPHLPPVANSWKGFRRLIHDAWLRQCVTLNLE